DGRRVECAVVARGRGRTTRSGPAAPARSALAEGDLAEALRMATAHAIARPADSTAARLYAAVASEVSDAGVEPAWRAVLALLPEDPEAHYMLGNLSGERGDFVAAADHFRAALLHAPKHPQLRASLGLA